MTTVLIVAAIALVVGHAPALGQGFGIYEHGACVMARGAAGVAQPCEDGSALAVNPAGAVGREGLTVGTGSLVVLGTGSFTADDGLRTDLERAVSPVPFGYLVYGVGPRLAIGIGAYAPYGLGVEWPPEFEGRFVSFESRLQTTYLQPTVAYAITDAVSVGGGPTLALSSVELHRREDLASVPLGATGLSFGSLVGEGTDFVTTSLTASGATGMGFHLGSLVRVNEHVRLGVRYLAEVALAYDGDAVFTPLAGNFAVTKPNPLGLPVGLPLDALVREVLASLPNGRGRTALDMPAQLVIGVSVRTTPRLTLLGDYQWVGWSAFDSVTLDFENPSTPDERLIQNYRDTSAGRVGGELQMSSSLRVRAGYAYTQAAAPGGNVTPLLPEARRNHLTAGIGWTVRPGLTFDVAYHFIGHADRRGRTRNPPGGVAPTPALNSGLYRSRGDLLGLTVTFRP